MITIDGLLLWEDDGDPVVVHETPNPGGPVTHDMVLQQALAGIWLEHDGPVNVQVTIEVME